MLKIKMIHPEQAARHAFIENIDPRRRQEVKDSMMLWENHNEFANFPTRPIHREFNQDRYDERFAFTMPAHDDEIGWDI